MKFILNCILGTILLTGISSCDPVTWSEVINTSNEEIRVILDFDSDKLTKSTDEKSFVPYLKSFGYDSNVILDSLDTVNLVGYYRVLPNDTFQVDFGIDTSPDFKFNRIVILQKNDTILDTSGSGILDKFTNSSGFTYQLKIN